MIQLSRMDKTLIEMLQKFGLEELEAKVYLSALQSKSGSAYEISKNLKTRTSVYSALAKLKQKGFISLTINKNKKIYRAKDILSLVEEKRNETEIISKNILTLSTHLLTLKHTGIKIFKGEDDLLEGLRYGINKGTPEDPKKIYCIYPSSSKITISPKDTMYYNFNVTLSKYNCKKIIISDTKVRSEYIHLDESLGFERHMIDRPILSDLSKLAIGIEIIEDSGVLKIIFYKENLILILENKELTDFGMRYILQTLISE